MSYNPSSTRKRPRGNDEDENMEDLRPPCPPQQRFENVSTHDHARQHNGDQYHAGGNVNIYHGAAVPTSASRSPEPTAIETALESLMFEEMDARYLTRMLVASPNTMVFSGSKGRPEQESQH
jgi:hypothetical protein